MEKQYISESNFIKNLKIKLDYEAPTTIFSSFERAYQKQVRANTELMDFLEDVRSTGIKTAILSNTIAIYQNIQEQLGVNKDHGFNPILYSWQVGMVKPQREIFELALDRLGARSDEVLFIDDKEGHLVGARAVGLKTILFESSHDTIHEIRRAVGMKA